ncbi:electron transport complex subunit E [Lentisphaerota bacterium WC36G]|nr:electron transport complex subunit E [Lentisphaerae bacterium WC36]
MQLFKDFVRGLWAENPVLVLLLGMCPTLAVTSDAKNALGMGLATTAVLMGSNLVISLIRHVVPKKVRIPTYIIVIATFVTAVKLSMKAYLPALNSALGMFIDLIVVNCIVLGRAEAFASKNGPIRSITDGLGMGLGFTFALVLLGGFREFLTSGSLFTYKIVEKWSENFTLPTNAVGAFVILGFFIAFMNLLQIRKIKKNGKGFYTPKEFDCSKCNICDLSGSSN